MKYVYVELWGYQLSRSKATSSLYPQNTWMCFCVETCTGLNVCGRIKHVEKIWNGSFERKEFFGSSFCVWPQLKRWQAYLLISKRYWWRNEWGVRLDTYDVLWGNGRDRWIGSIEQLCGISLSVWLDLREG